MDNELLFLVLLPASLFDLYRYRIPNAIPVTGILIGLIRHLEQQGLNGVWPWLAGMIFPLFRGFLLFRWRMFGASDGKLMAAAGSYVGVPGVFFLLIFSLSFPSPLSSGTTTLYSYRRQLSTLFCTIFVRELDV